MLTFEEMRKMVGTPYIHEFSDGDHMKGVVAAFDPFVGMTCLATDAISKDGTDFTDDEDENGNICLVAYDAVNDAGCIKLVEEALTEIMETGRLSPSGGGDGNPECAF